MVAGKAASSARAETFSAMAAIMFSAAEATKNDIFRDKIDYVIAVFRNTKLFFSELSSSLLIVATVDRDTDDAKILENMNNIVTRTKEELVCSAERSEGRRGPRGRRRSYEKVFKKNLHQAVREILLDAVAVETA
jgi:predicted regulator of Ras-like GTPase activity (Roadblock/LC7/MglB family)